MASRDMPSSDINPGNALQRVEECQKYMTLGQWSKFEYLYRLLAKFQDIRVRGTGKMRDDDEFTIAWNTLRANSVDSMLKNLESAQSFEVFLDWMQRLSDIIKDPRCLWNILHTEVQPTLKITLEQSHEIAAKFFTPEMLFEYGLDSFLASCLCDFTAVKNDEELIDVFYAAAGYVRACGLPEKYEVKAPHFIEFVNRMLIVHTTLPDFDAHRFVWLVEAIKNNLHLSTATFRGICESVLKEFANKDFEQQALSMLHKMCIISTSPFLQEIPTLKTSIDNVFKRVIKEQHKFTHRYIFGCFVSIMWDGEEEPELSEPLQAWKLYLENLDQRIKEKPELPNLLMMDLIIDSLTYFIGYYGEVQPSKARAVNLRRDIFEIVDLCIQYHPGKMSEETLSKVWYLLYIVAVSGASDAELEHVEHLDCKECSDPYLGLEHTDRSFADYKLALGRLSKKFEAEFQAFPSMVEFIRVNYNQ